MSKLNTSNGEIVVMANDLINARQETDLYQRRIFYYYLSKIENDVRENPDKIPLELTISVKDFKEFTGLSTKAAGQYLKKSIDDLYNRSIEVRPENLPDNIEEYVFRIIGTKAKYTNGTYKIKFYKPFVEGLLKIAQENGFTQILTADLAKIRSNYSMRIFEKLKSEEHRHQAKLEMWDSDFRFMLDIQDKYKDSGAYSNFLKKHLQILVDNGLLLSADYKLSGRGENKKIIIFYKFPSKAKPTQTSTPKPQKPKEIDTSHKQIPIDDDLLKSSVPDDTQKEEKDLKAEEQYFKEFDDGCPF